MKKIVLTLAILLFAATVYADSYQQLDFQSSEYARTLSRNASTDVDAVYFNPAGTAFLKDGLYFQLGDDIIIEKITAKDLLTNQAGVFGFSGDAERKSLIPYFGRFYAVYKMDKLAINFGFLPFYGGGYSFEGDTADAFYKGLVFEEANATAYDLTGDATTAQVQAFTAASAASADEMKLTRIYMGPTLGVSYAVNDMIALGINAKYAFVVGSFKIDDEDYQKFSGGFLGGAFSIAAKPVKEMVASLYFEYNTKFEIETEYVDTNTTEKNENQVPPKLGIGLSYMITPELKTEASFNYYLTSMLGELEDSDGIKSKPSDGYDDGMDIAIAFEYAITPTLKASLGYQYTKYGQKNHEDAIDLFSNDMDHHAIATGATLTAMPGLDITLGLFTRLYPSVTSSVDNGDSEYTKSRYHISIGATYKAL